MLTLIFISYSLTWINQNQKKIFDRITGFHGFKRLIKYTGNELVFGFANLKPSLDPFLAKEGR